MLPGIGIRVWTFAARGPGLGNRLEALFPILPLAAELNGHAFAGGFDF